MCFWGDKTAHADFSGSPVIVIKNAKVSDFAVKSLNANEDSQVYLGSRAYEVAGEQARDIRMWYD